MHIIGIGIFTAPSAGGAYQYTRSVLQAASVIMKRDAQYTFKVYSEYPMWEDICKSMGIDFIKIQSTFTEKCLYHAAYILGKAGMDNSALYANHPIWKAYDRDGLELMMITSPSWYGKPKGKKCMMPIFDLMHRYIDFEEVGGNGIAKERDRRYEAICKNVDGVIVDSKLGVMQLIDCYGEHVENLIARTYALPFIVPDYISDNVQGVRPEADNLPQKYLLYPAQFWKHKNHTGLLDAAGELKKQGVNVNLVFTGTDKNAAEDIAKKIEEHELTEQVTNLGYITDEQLVYLYKHARAMIFPSFGGPTNIPPLEAMALGCPVAVANNFAMPEQIGKAGLTFDPADIHAISDCMRRLWMDDELCEKLSSAGIDRSEEWTVNEFADALKEIICQIL